MDFIFEGQSVLDRICIQLCVYPMKSSLKRVFISIFGLHISALKNMSSATLYGRCVVPLFDHAIVHPTVRPFVHPVIRQNCQSLSASFTFKVYCRNAAPKTLRSFPIGNAVVHFSPTFLPVAALFSSCLPTFPDRLGCLPMVSQPIFLEADRSSVAIYPSRMAADSVHFLSILC